MAAAADNRDGHGKKVRHGPCIAVGSENTRAAVLERLTQTYGGNMDLKQHGGHLSAADPESAVEFYVHGLVAVLLLSATLLSGTAESYVEPVEAGLPSIYLAMAR
jgi:hypothetical protein